MIELFVSFGYPIWFMYFTGLLEVAGADSVAAPSSATTTLREQAPRIAL